MTTTDMEPMAEPTSEPEPKPTLEARVYRLAALRVQRASQQAKIDDARQIFDRIFREAWRGELEILESLKAAVAEEDAALRTEAEDVYVATGNKHPAKGVDVKETKVYGYDTEECLRWAIEGKHAALLKLDDAAFRKVAETLKAPTFVVHIVPLANIAKELPLEETSDGQ